MSDVLTEAFIIGLLATTLRAATPLLLGGLGEALSQRSGVINVGLEGYMISGAFFGYLVAHYSGSPWIGALGGMVAGGLAALLAAYVMITRRADQIVTGLAIVILAAGLTGTLYRTLFRNESTMQPERVPVHAFSHWDIPMLSDIPWVGDILFRQVPIVYVAIVAVFVVWLVMRSRVGLKVRAAGEHPEALETAGSNVIRIRYACVVATGLMAGLGGVYLSIGQTETYEEGLTGGRGFIALGVAIVGRRHPVGVLVAALAFAMADAMQLWLPSAGIEASHHLLGMLPYIVTIVALAGVLGKVRHPRAFLKPFARQS
ncbi:MAG: ABC transporter permease [Solirubrobacteraceae bacterium]|nr:ABC transporter permease [Solirubrobacteraceae bacterium]